MSLKARFAKCPIIMVKIVGTCSIDAVRAQFEAIAWLVRNATQVHNTAGSKMCFS